MTGLKCAWAGYQTVARECGLAACRTRRAAVGTCASITALQLRCRTTEMPGCRGEGMQGAWQQWQACKLPGRKAFYPGAVHTCTACCRSRRLQQLTLASYLLSPRMTSGAM